jgi:membrane dipeptidase
MRLAAKLVLLAVATAADADSTDAERLQRASTLARDELLVDTHIDVPYRLREAWADVTVATPDGDFDHPRALAGGLDVAFMSIYTPPALEAAGGSAQLAHELIDSVEAIAARAPQRYALVHSTLDVKHLAKPGRVLLALGMENGSPIEGKLENLQRFHARGVRYITLAHGLSNHISDSSYDEKRPWDGLSPFGIEVVREMNRLGIMVDVSHLSDAAVRDVLDASAAPVIASHSSARRFTPDWERNLSDELIRAIAEEGGVVQINFGSSFITAAAHSWSLAEHAASEAWVKANGLDADSEAAGEFARKYAIEHPFPHASVADVADHYDHVVKLVGIDHVGIGSDFDGVGPTLPAGLKSVADYPNLVAELMRRGYSDNDLRKLLGANLMRVWGAVEKQSGATAGKGR